MVDILLSDVETFSTSTCFGQWWEFNSRHNKKLVANYYRLLWKGGFEFIRQVCKWNFKAKSYARNGRPVNSFVQPISLAVFSEKEIGSRLKILRLQSLRIPIPLALVFLFTEIKYSWKDQSCSYFTLFTHFSLILRPGIFYFSFNSLCRSLIN